MITERFQENLAAIALQFGALAAVQPISKGARDALEGQAGLGRLLIRAASAFTHAEIELDPDWIKSDWYESVDRFVASLHVDLALDDPSGDGYFIDDLENANLLLEARSAIWPDEFPSLLRPKA